MLDLGKHKKDTPESEPSGVALTAATHLTLRGIAAQFGLENNIEDLRCSLLEFLRPQ